MVGGGPRVDRTLLLAEIRSTLGYVTQPRCGRNATYDARPNERRGLIALSDVGPEPGGSAAIGSAVKDLSRG